MSSRKTLSRLLLPLAAAGTMLLSTAAPVQAAPRSDACASWGCGSVTFTFVDRDTIRPVSLSVKDARCDDWHVWIRLEMEYSTGRRHYTPQFLANGCGSYSVRNSYWEASGNIREARALLRRSDGSRSDFAYGTWRDNPHTS